ncbi:hypothetical protein M2405_001983 [Rhodococcus erythropolis]|uniref:DUF5691 domain-containing protein n=1 Tax=Rhodococcus erythropolis TaxID=1833 RepID=UPI002168C11B|nr:DUF5691 domain-containing protein [Rhodococcus erythropolis]MCS4253705.1 hypothetical protein [Rhodococcus erythropolis]MCW2427256.1 hypothetical protein [Rhodococcus erythropolis]
MSTLISVALLGTARTSTTFEELPAEVRGHARELDGDPAEMLLAAAALERAYRRGGAGSTTAAVPTPAPDDVRFTLPESSSAHLLSMLAAKATLLDEWFAVALERNYRAPDHLVAELLSFARASEAHRESILQIVGERGRWLAAQNPEWSKLVRTRDANPDVWRHGSSSQRTQWLIDTRRTDPALALAELRKSWGTERGEQKAAFVSTLAIGSSADDQPLLEEALDDRRKDVRRAAAEVLGRIPESEFGERMAARVQKWARVERKLLRSTLVILPPEEVDAASRRDGIEDRPNPHTDYRAEYVRQAISSAPLSLWNNMIGEPGKVMGMSVDEGWEPILHDAWSTAAVAQNNAEWALELFRIRGTATDRRLLPLVPAKALADLLRSGNGDANVLHPGRAAIYDALRGPWPDDITRAVVAQWERVAARRADGGAKAGEFSRYKYSASLRLAESRFPYSAVTLLDRAAERARDPDWRQTFARTASAITHRKTLLEELT